MLDRGLVVGARMVGVKPNATAARCGGFVPDCTRRGGVMIAPGGGFQGEDGKTFFCPQCMEAYCDDAVVYEGLAISLDSGDMGD